MIDASAGEIYLFADLTRTAKNFPMITKDAVYCAAGLCAHDLYDYFAFEPWLKNSLAIEASDKSPE